MMTMPNHQQQPTQLSQQAASCSTSTSAAAWCLKGCCSTCSLAAGSYQTCGSSTYQHSCTQRASLQLCQTPPGLPTAALGWIVSG